MPRIFGRTVRFSAPPEVTNPLIYMEHPGYVHLPEDLEERRGDIAESQLDRRGLALISLRNALRAKSGISFLNHTFFDKNDGHIHGVVLVADKDGNVSAHHDGVFGKLSSATSVSAADTYENDPGFDWGFGGGESFLSNVEKSIAKADSEEYKEAHKKAVDSGKLFAKANFNREYANPHLVKEMLKAGDEDPWKEMEISDYLDEQGYGRAGHAIRKRQREVIPGYTKASKDDPEILNKLDRAFKYPDALQILARHERTPEQDETKRLIEDRLEEDENFGRTGRNPFGNPKVGWRLSHGQRIFGRTIPATQFAYKTLRIKSHTPEVEDQNTPVYHSKPRPSDLTEHQWVKVMPLFPEKVIYAKNRKTPVRVLLNATMYRLINNKTLRQTVLEAPDFPPWGSIHFFEETMRRQGLWPEFLKRIGRLDLLDVLKKRMRLTPEQMRMSLEDSLEKNEGLKPHPLEAKPEQIKKLEEEHQKYGPKVGRYGTDNMKHLSKEQQEKAQEIYLRAVDAHPSEHDEYLEHLHTTPGLADHFLKADKYPDRYHRWLNDPGFVSEYVTNAHANEWMTKNYDVSNLKNAARAHIEPIRIKTKLTKSDVDRLEKTVRGFNPLRRMIISVSKDEVKFPPHDRDALIYVADKDGNLLFHGLAERDTSYKTRHLYEGKNNYYFLVNPNIGGEEIKGDFGRDAYKFGYRNGYSDEAKKATTGAPERWMLDSFKNDAGVFDVDHIKDLMKLLGARDFMEGKMPFHSAEHLKTKDGHEEADLFAGAIADSMGEPEAERVASDGTLNSGRPILETTPHSGPPIHAVRSFISGAIKDRYKDILNEDRHGVKFINNPDSPINLTVEKIIEDRLRDAEEDNAMDVFDRTVSSSAHGHKKNFYGERWHTQYREDFNPHNVGAIHRLHQSPQFALANGKPDEFAKILNAYRAGGKRMRDMENYLIKAGDKDSYRFPFFVEGVAEAHSQVGGNYSRDKKNLFALLHRANMLLDKSDGVPEEDDKKAELDWHKERWPNMDDNERAEIIERDVEDARYLRRLMKRNGYLGEKKQMSLSKVFGRTVRFSCQEHEYGCLLVRLPPFLSAQVLAFGSAIPDDLLAGDGRETAPHITIKYGFEDEDKDCVLAKVIEFESPSVTLGKVRCFKNDDADVLYVEVDSHDLERMHTALTPMCKREDDHPYYTPHVTIAYLKPGAADPYLGDTSFEGLAFDPPKAFFSCKGGDETHAHFAECCQTEDEVVEAVTQRIFGRTVRFAAPPEVTNPLIYMEHPGYVHLPEHLEGRRGDIAISPGDRRIASLEMLRKALKKDGGLAFADRVFSDRYITRGQDSVHKLILVADKDGNVTAHHADTFDGLHNGGDILDAQDYEDDPDFIGNLGLGDRELSRVRRSAAKTTAEAYREAHEKAVASGDLFAKAHFNSENANPHLVKEMLKGGREDPWKEMELADYLDEQGYGRAGNAIRKRHRKILPEANEADELHDRDVHRKRRRAAAYPDALQMLTRHERTPEQDETKRLIEDRLEEDENFGRTGRNPFGNPKIGWRLSHGQRIFGRTVRMSTDDGGPKSPLEFEHVGKLANGEHEGDTCPFNTPVSLRERARESSINGMVNGNLMSMSLPSFMFHGEEGNPKSFILTSSGDGTTVAHRMNEDDLLSEVAKRKGNDWRSGGIGEAIRKRREALREMHDEAVAKGHVYARIKNNAGRYLPPMVKHAIATHRDGMVELGGKYDHAPFLIFADYLDEEGFSNHAEQIRRRHSADDFYELDGGPYDSPHDFLRELTTSQDPFEEYGRFSLSGRKVFGRTVRLAFDRPLKQLEFDFDALEKANQEPSLLRDDIPEEEREKRARSITESDYFVELRKKAADRRNAPRIKPKPEGAVAKFLDWLGVDVIESPVRRNNLPEERVPMPETRSPEELARIKAAFDAEVERARKERQVTDITQTDYFQNLRRKAQALKDKKEGKK